MRENPAPMAARSPAVVSSTVTYDARYQEPRTSRAELEDGAQSVFQGRRVACSLQREDLGTGLVVLRRRVVISIKFDRRLKQLIQLISENLYLNRLTMNRESDNRLSKELDAR
jgi:hypothetical protein